MEIGRIQPKLNSNVKMAQTISFQGGASTAVKTADEMITEGLPYSAKLLNKFKPLQGEIGSIILTAIGTGAVAPIFIAYNPLSKTDEDTKKYTAMRQPVSAALAILIQVGLSTPIAKFVEKLANKGLLGDAMFLNRKNFNTDGYLESEFKKMTRGKGFKAEMKLHTDAQMKKIIDTLNAEGTFKLGGKTVDKETMVEVVNATIESYTESMRKDLVKEKEKNIPAKVKRAQLLYSLKPAEGETESAIMRQLQTIANAADMEDAKTKLAAAIQTERNADVKVLWEECLKDPSIDPRTRAGNTLKKIAEYSKYVEEAKEMHKASEQLNNLFKAIKDAKSLDEIKKIIRLSNNENLPEIVLSKIKNLEKRVSLEGRKLYADYVLDKLKALTESGIADDNKIIEINQSKYYAQLKSELELRISLYERLKLKETSGKTEIDHITKQLKQLNEKIDFKKDLVGTWKKFLDGNFKGFKQISTALFATFILLPITCTALNWVYPKFMDTFFPSLSKNDSSGPPKEAAKNAKGVSK